MPYKDKTKNKSCIQKYNKTAYNKNPEIQKAKVLANKERVKAEFFKIKSTLCCRDCGQTHIATLQFHHLDPTKKDNNVSWMVHHGYSLKRIQAEIEKCVVLCSNCHDIIHWKEKQV